MNGGDTEMTKKAKKKNQPSTKSQKKKKSLPKLPLLRHTKFQALPPLAASQANGSSKEKATAMTIEALHNITHFKKWKTAVKKQIAAATGQPQLGFKWACEIDDAKSWRDLSESCPFPVTDLNLATAINKIKGGAIRNKIDIADEECDRQNRMMMGRQMLWIYYDENRIASVDKSIVDWSTLLDCKYKNGNLSGFWHEWTMILNNLVDQPSE